jgi:hypothetical protein
MPTPEERLAELGLTVPEVVPPLAACSRPRAAGTSCSLRAARLPRRRHAGDGCSAMA